MAPDAPATVEPPTPTRRLACLVVVSGQEPGRVIHLQRASLVIGRDPQAGIRILDHGVSRRHARLRIRGGRVRLTDLGSTNGTWHNGRRLREEAVLCDGDQLRLGGSRLTFRANSPDDMQRAQTHYHRATRDALTCLLNRVSIEERLHREVERHKRYKQGLAVIRLEIDALDRIGRDRGAQAAVRVIRQVARAVRCGLRSCDLAARAGTASFVLVLPACNLPRARSVAERLRVGIATLRVTHAGKRVPVTARLGLAVAAGASTTAAKLLAAAAADCRRAAQGGGDRAGGGERLA